MHSMCLSTTCNTISKYSPCSPFHCSLDHWSSSYIIDLRSACISGQKFTKCIRRSQIILIPYNLITICVPCDLISSLIFPFTGTPKPDGHRYAVT
nr:hypothetical protein Iba_chr06eCG0470 [Ipomoea batatas]